MSDNPQPEQIVEGSVNDATQALEGADALTLARARQAEIARSDGPRASLLARLDSASAQADKALVDAGQGIPLDDLDYAAQLAGVDVSIMRATRVYLGGRTRVSEDELRAAVAHVGSREV